MHMNTYETSDLGLATAFLAIGHELLEVDKSHPRRASFKFACNEDANVDANDYWNNKLQVSALAYFEAMKRLKTRLYT